MVSNFPKNIPLLVNFIIHPGLKCFECFTKDDCNNIKNNSQFLVDCNHASVQAASTHFHFLPNVMSQLPSDEFYCAGYEGLRSNTTELTLKGCFYSTYNPCAFLPMSDSNIAVDSGYRCKYCNLHDGCNAAGSNNGGKVDQRKAWWIVMVMIGIVLSINYRK